MSSATLAGPEKQKPQIDYGLYCGPPTQPNKPRHRKLPPFVKLAARFISKNPNLTLSSEQLAAKVNSFHADPNNKAGQTLAPFGFEAAMERLVDYPETRAEMLSRTLGSSMLGGWRPINDRERGLLNNWVTELSAVAPYLAVEYEMSRLMEIEHFGAGELQLNLENEITSARLDSELREELGKLANPDGYQYPSPAEQLAVIIRLDTRVQETVELSVAA